MTDILNALYLLMIKVPLLGKYIKILNAYAYKGNPKYIKELAPLNLLKKRIYPAWRNSFLIAFFICLFVIYTDIKTYDPGEYIIGAVPDLLGFAIGVFALIFVLPTGLREFISKTGGKNFPIEEIPADVAYPLMGLVLVLVSCFFLELLPDTSWLSIYLETVLVLFSFEMIIEMIMFIYLLNRVNVSSVVYGKPKRFYDRKKEQDFIIKNNKHLK